MMRASRTISSILAALLVLASASCAYDPAQRLAYNAFLKKIAQDCKPLIIGPENLGEALVYDGVGVDPRNYEYFLDQTQSLFSGAISQESYRDSLTAFLGPGTFNDRSFQCIFAHLPQH
jgi:hypothetical protein